MAIARWLAGLTPAMMRQIDEWRSLPDHPHYSRGQMTLALLLRKSPSPVAAGLLLHLLNVWFLEASQGPLMALVSSAG